MKIEEVIKTERFESDLHKATINLLYTTYWFKTHISAKLKEHSLTSEQYNVLRILKGKYPAQMCIKDIASRMIEKNSNVPRIIDRLLEKDLVKRTISDIDRRETLIELTDTGLKILQDSSSALTEVTNMLGLNDEEAAQLNKLLEKLRND